jgi:hypothetical protein
LEENAMRWAVVFLCVLLIGGCPPVVTENQARDTCAAVGFSDTEFNDAVNLAQGDEADGLSAAESKSLFRGDCADGCGEEQACVNDCTTCTTAVVDFVYSN